MHIWTATYNNFIFVDRRLLVSIGLDGYHAYDKYRNKEQSVNVSERCTSRFRETSLFNVGVSTSNGDIHARPGNEESWSGDVLCPPSDRQSIRQGAKRQYKVHLAD